MSSPGTKVIEVYQVSTVQLICSSGVNAAGFRRSSDCERFSASRVRTRILYDIG
jgi:hypothetical protein